MARRPKHERTALHCAALTLSQLWTRAASDVLVRVLKPPLGVAALRRWLRTTLPQGCRPTPVALSSPHAGAASHRMGHRGYAWRRTLGWGPSAGRPVCRMATSTTGIRLVSIRHVHAFNPIDGRASSDALPCATGSWRAREYGSMPTSVFPHLPRMPASDDEKSTLIPGGLEAVGLVEADRMQ